MKITWKRGKHSTYHGYVGKLSLMAVAYDLSRRNTWVVSSPLPGLKVEDLPDGTTAEDAKLAAERAISNWFEYCARAGAEDEAEHLPPTN